jgi:hypothetical protein
VEGAIDNEGFYDDDEPELPYLWRSWPGANNIYFIFIAKWIVEGAIDNEGFYDDDEPELNVVCASQLSDMLIP